MKNQNKQTGQSLIEVLVVLVLAAMMIVALISIILLSLKNAQFAQNQTKATKIAQDTIDQIRILRDDNKYGTLTLSGQPAECFNILWDSSNSNFGCEGNECYYMLTTPGLNKKDSLSGKENLEDGFFRQIKVTQNTPSEVKVAVEVSWTDSTGEHSSKLETYLIKPNYECID